MNYQQIRIFPDRFKALASYTVKQFGGLLPLFQEELITSKIRPKR
jgi:hypothetical protein